MNNWPRNVLVLILISGSVFFLSLGKARLWDRDEPRNAGCAQEMMQRGDWVVPVFNDELRHQKPVLLYWLMIGAYKVFGVNEFAARFWSALLGCGTVLLTYSIGRRLFTERIGLVAGVALATSLMFVVAARAATPDSLLIFCSTLGIYLYVRGTFQDDADGKLSLRSPGQWFPQKTIDVIAMNLAFGLGVLAKGPVGLVLPTAIIGMFLLIQRLPHREAESWGWRTVVMNALQTLHPWHFLKTCWYMRPLLAIICVVTVAFPWFLAVGVQTEGQFTNLFFLNENFNRATSVMENHQGGLWFYPLAIAIGFFPWSVFLGPVAVSAYQAIRNDPEKRPVVSLLLCWVIVQVALFSLAKTKLPSYVTPCYPAIALLTAFCLVDWLPEKLASRRVWLLGAYGALTLGGVLASAALIYATFEFMPQIKWVAAIGLVPIIGGILGIWLVYSQRQQNLVRLISLTAIVFCLLFFGVGTVAVDSTRETDRIIRHINLAQPNRKVATYRCLESSWVYYAGRPIYELARLPDVDNKTQTLEREKWWDRKPEISPEDFSKQFPDAIFVTTDEFANKLLARLPDDYSIVQQSRFFLKSNRQLILIENSRPETASADPIHVVR